MARPRKKSQRKRDSNLGPPALEADALTTRPRKYIMYPSYLLCISKFGLPPSASCQVNRNVNDEECLPLVSVSKGCNLSLKFRITFTLTNFIEKSLPQNTDFPSTVRNGATRGIMVRTSAFRACHQWYSVRSSLAWGLDFRALVCGFF